MQQVIATNRTTNYPTNHSIINSTIYSAILTTIYSAILTTIYTTMIEQYAGQPCNHALHGYVYCLDILLIVAKDMCFILPNLAL